MAKRYTEEELQKIEMDFRSLFEDTERAYLVVDQSIAARKMISNALRSAGCEIIMEAKDGVDAMMKAREHPRGLVVITEVNLPMVNGLALLQQIREDDELGETPVLVVSAESRKEVIVAAVRGGAKAYLKKPFEPDTITGKLQELNLL